jgi:acyl carrier protein
VREAAVVTRAEGGELRLVGYVVMKEQETSGEAELRQYLRERLPEHMIPMRLVRMKELPLTGSGKLDRKALPAPSQDRPDLPSYVGPRTDLENKIVGVWKETLNLETVGVNHNFFDLGGHSLLLVKLHTKLMKMLGLEFPLLALFEHPTVRAFCNYLKNEHNYSLRSAAEKGVRRRERLARASSTTKAV